MGGTFVSNHGPLSLFLLLSHVTAIVLSPGSVMNTNATSTRRSSVFGKQRTWEFSRFEQSKARVMSRPSVKRVYSQGGM